MHKHIIQVSTYQMCILMLFNKKDNITCEVRTNPLPTYRQRFTAINHITGWISRVESHGTRLQYVYITSFHLLPTFYSR
jgi:hypothetical protein